MDPAAVSWGAGHIAVFVRGDDEALWRRTYANAAWGTWESLGGTLNASPAVASTGSEQFNVVIRHSDDTLWYRTYNGTWGPWLSMGEETAASAPALAATDSTLVAGSCPAIWVV